MKTVALYLICVGCILPLSLFGQRGKIIRTASSTIMDPNQDGFVSKTNSGFSNDGYYVDEFEITMFGIPQIGGDVTGDNVGNSCGITDLTPDNKGRSVYAVRDGGDDFSLVMDGSGRRGALSSNREGGVGYDDIYSFQVKSFFVVGKAIERNDSAKTVPRAKISVMNEKGYAIDSTYSDQDGYFHFDLDFDKDYKFSASKEGFSWVDSLHFSTNTRALGRDSLLIPLWRHTLFAKGSVYSNETQDKLPDAVVLLENITDGRIDSVVTNPTGAYNFLLTPNKKYRVRAHKEGFIPRQFELNTAGLTSGDLVNDFLLEEVFMEKIALQFNFDKWKLKPLYNQQLEEIAAILKRNDKCHLHIGAYADSHGTHEYNLALSNKRAHEVVSYFESKGIEVKKITAIGFGEELLLNQCSNGVKCTVEDHSKNRRVELKVQLWKGD